jgi:hypothetical protein
VNGTDAYVAGVRVFAAGLLFGGEHDAEEFAGATLDELTGVMLRHKNLWAPMVVDAGTSDAYKSCALADVFGDVCAVETGLFRKLDWLAESLRAVEGAPSDIVSRVHDLAGTLGWWTEIANLFDGRNGAKPRYLAHRWLTDNGGGAGGFDGDGLARVLVRCTFAHEACVELWCDHVGEGRYRAISVVPFGPWGWGEDEIHRRLAEALAA